MHNPLQHVLAVLFVDAMADVLAEYALAEGPLAFRVGTAYDMDLLLSFKA